MKLEEIQESWSSDSQIDDTELDNESLKIPDLHHKYSRIFLKLLIICIQRDFATEI